MEVLVLLVLKEPREHRVQQVLVVLVVRLEPLVEMDLKEHKELRELLVAALLRARHPGAVTVGVGGTGPLIQLGMVKEYLAARQPRSHLPRRSRRSPRRQGESNYRSQGLQAVQLSLNGCRDYLLPDTQGRHQ